MKIVKIETKMIKKEILRESKSGERRIDIRRRADYYYRRNDRRPKSN